MKRSFAVFALTILLLPGFCSAQKTSDVFVVTVELRDNQIKVLEVTQDPSFDQPAATSGEYRLEISRDGKKVADRFFDLALGEMEVIPPEDSSRAPEHITAPSALKHLVLPIAGDGTTDQYMIRVYRGDKEVFSSSLDKLPFSRSEGVSEPVRSKSEVELLKKSAAAPAAATTTPGETAQRGFSWSFIIVGIIILAGAGIGIRYWYLHKKQNDQNI